MRKNIGLGYALTFLHNSFFWYAPWLLFLLNHITFQQAAILQTIGLVTSALLEVPTGVLSDLIGKKKTLHVAFLLASIGEVYVAFSGEFYQFVISYVVIFAGYSFYSGTMEAFMYDTLAAEGDTQLFKRILSRSSAIKSAAIVVSTLVGGFLFSIWAGLPFLLTGITKFIGFLVTFFIDEPAVDTDTFSLKKYLEQSREGFAQLFGPRLRRFAILLFTFSVFQVSAYEILDDITVIEYGYSAASIGILFACAILLSIPAGLLYERVSTRIHPLYLIFAGMLFLSVNYVANPWIGVTVWTALFLFRVGFSAFRNNAISEILNSAIASNIRATTLSTYSMLTILPFMVFSGTLAGVVEQVGLREFNALFFGLFFVLGIPQMVLLVKSGGLDLNVLEHKQREV